MKKYLALYKKELKSISGMAIFLFVSIIAVYIYDFIAQNILDIHYPYNFYGYKFALASVFMLPVILAYSLNIEIKSRTHYLGLSLPVHKHTIMLFKFLAVITIGVIPIVVMNVEDVGEFIKNAIDMCRFVKADPELLKYYSQHTSVKHFESFPYKYIVQGTIRILYMNFWYDNVRYFMQLFAYCGMVCFAQGVMMTVKRYRVFVWTVAFMASFSLFVMFYEKITGTPVYLYSAYIQKYNPVAYYSFWAGLLSLSIGLFLYERYAEI